MSKKINDTIKKLKLKKGCKYLIIFPESSGMKAHDLASIPHLPELMDVTFLVKSTKGIKVIEKEME